jgi:N-acetylmuramoyl-L-alanine amidase CwlA
MVAWRDDFIRINQYSRPGSSLTAVRKIILHYTANPGASASNHQRYFNNLTDRYASAHLFVDKIEAICIIPLNEVSYQANDGSYRGVEALKPNANFLSVGVEMCQEPDGSFHPDTVTRAVQVCADLCRKFGLSASDIVRHYDVTHKYCPGPYVDNAALFTAFKNRVGDVLGGGSGGGTGGTTPPTTPPTGGGGNGIGTAYITGTGVNLRSGPGTSYSVIRQLNAPESYIVWEERDGWLNVGNSWIKNDSSFVRFERTSGGGSTGGSTGGGVGDTNAGKRVVSKVDGLNFYSRPTWDKTYVVGQCNAGEGFTIVTKVPVDDAYQYKVQNSKGATYYITASPTYVEIR